MSGDKAILKLTVFASHLRVGTRRVPTVRARLEGKTAKQISESCGISVDTVYQHFREVDELLGTNGVGGWAAHVLRSVLAELATAASRAGGPPIERVLADMGVPDIADAHPADAALWIGFSDKEASVVRLLLDGKRRKRIAKRLGLSAREVKRTLETIYRRLGVSRPARGHSGPCAPLLAQRLVDAYVERLHATLASLASRVSGAFDLASVLEDTGRDAGRE